MTAFLKDVFDNTDYAWNPSAALGALLHWKTPQKVFVNENLRSGCHRSLHGTTVSPRINGSARENMRATIRIGPASLAPGTSSLVIALFGSVTLGSGP
jgi:hypothetical protein